MELRAAASWTRAGLEVCGDIVWFPACPARYVTAWTLQMLEWFSWLDLWGKTPIDVGATHDQVDPRYWPAMQVLKLETNRIEREELERIKTENGRK